MLFWQKRLKLETYTTALALVLVALVALLEIFAAGYG